MFNKESDFEDALVNLLLSEKGWQEVIKNPTEQDLIDNWAKILFDNNRDIDRLNDYPLTSTEMQQIIDQINNLKTPVRLNSFINGKTVSIKRDNPDDALHIGKEVSLHIYDRMEIAGGKSRYQIARQPKFPTKSKILNDRRGDLMLLINGMPVFHIELKKSGVPISQAYNQIENYARVGIFTGFFSLVQVFLAMNPEETVYFANPGPEGKFNPNFYFHWANLNNEALDNWKDIASHLISIPMAHMLIGFYTVADNSDGILKAMRSYQFYAANEISDRVTKIKWGDFNQLGGYIWHTTGSGKTMTSFKSAQLIANSKDADKVVFLVDRIELGTQSLNEYRGFADENESVQATEDTTVLVSKLKSSDPANTLIVTSIQKMSNIKNEAEGLKASDLKTMQSKRIVFIIDECHRSTFGEMLLTIKATFPSAIFFGFTGTPIHEENQKKDSTTATVFGNELHRYSIADGIRDKNVLGFDCYMVTTFDYKELRKIIAMEKAKAKTEDEVFADETKKKAFYDFMDNATDIEIEEHLPNSQYDNDEHRKQVVKDIIEKWRILSRGNKFHAIFATNSISEAIKYYRLFKKSNSDLKITALFDPNIDNVGNGADKEEGLAEIIDDYNKLYEMDFTIPNHALFKKDIASRLAHKKPYVTIENTQDLHLDLLIVVNQMLTGFDSKWVNTLYLDKLLEYADIIQAFSRTNRLFGPDKPFGTIKYYRKPHTMELNIEKAVKRYSGDKPFGLFVDKLPENIKNLNRIFEDITSVFTGAGVSDFEKLPEDTIACGKFASLFKKLYEHLEAAKIQGLILGQPDNGLDFGETTYKALVLRYKELSNSEGRSGGGSGGTADVPYDIAGHLTEIDTGKIDADYMNSNFIKYLRLLNSPDTPQDLLEKVKNDLHRTFATLTQVEQKYANLILNDINRGEFIFDDKKSFSDYITDYQYSSEEKQINKFSRTLGVDIIQLQAFMKLKVSDSNINEFGRFDKLVETIDYRLAKVYFEKKEGHSLNQAQISIKIDSLLREFIIKGGFDID